MKAQLLNLAIAAPTEGDVPDIVVSFRPFLDYLEQRKQHEHTVKAEFFQFVLDQFRSSPMHEKDIILDQTQACDRLLELMYVILSQPIHEEQAILWGLSAPITPMVFYGTDALYNLLYDEANAKVRQTVTEPEREAAAVNKPRLTYALILDRLYGFNYGVRYSFVRSIRDAQTGAQKFYRLHLDPRFINVSAKAELPQLTFEKAQTLLHDPDGLAELNKLLPMSLFRFEGLSVLTITDITEQEALEALKSVILKRETYKMEEYYGQVTDSLKLLVETNDVGFGVLPILKVNDKLVFNDSTCMNSTLVESAKGHGMAEKAYLAVADNYFKNPRLLLFKKITPDDEERQIFLKLLKQDGICAYALIPIFYNAGLAGVLEVFSKKEGELTEAILQKLEPAIPLVAQILHNNIEEFETKIENIIREKYTSLQPSVQWKFNEVAWHYLKGSYLSQNRADIETIVFPDVHPLYGAIDIRNSTIERNSTLKKDLETQFRILIQTLSGLKQQISLSLIDEIIFKSKRKLRGIVDSLTGSEEMDASDFFENEVEPFLTHFEKINPIVTPTIKAYRDAVDEKTGAAFENRRQLETSMHMITSAINNHLDLFATDPGHAYPCYFEKFRTDGVEYDIYIGQSIAPDRPFDHLYLKNLRLWQLSSMAAIARLTHSLLPQLPRKLQTTQLIFAHSNTIDICFRNDERRFDVEGAYNIRYQVIKKRIDKVHIKDTDERLTQPGKIAIVYFNQKEADEYIKYINYLREQQAFTDDVEELELEELQGVRGLKALRIGVMLD